MPFGISFGNIFKHCCCCIGSQEEEPFSEVVKMTDFGGGDIDLDDAFDTPPPKIIMQPPPILNSEEGSQGSSAHSSPTSTPPPRPRSQSIVHLNSRGVQSTSYHGRKLSDGVYFKDRSDALKVWLIVLLAKRNFNIRDSGLDVAKSEAEFLQERMTKVPSQFWAQFYRLCERLVDADISEDTNPHAHRLDECEGFRSQFKADLLEPQKNYLAKSMPLASMRSFVEKLRDVWDKDWENASSENRVRLQQRDVEVKDTRDTTLGIVNAVFKVIDPKGSSEPWLQVKEEMLAF